jgi:hypothetical protein
MKPLYILFVPEKTVEDEAVAQGLNSFPASKITSGGW